MKVINIKLKDGRQIIAKSDKEQLNEPVAYLEDPMTVSVNLNQENKPQIHLFPYVVEIGINRQAALSMEAVEAVASVSEELENYYRQQTSGIDLTTKLK